MIVIIITVVIIIIIIIVIIIIIIINIILFFTLGSIYSAKANGAGQSPKQITRMNTIYKRDRGFELGTTLNKSSQPWFCCLSVLRLLGIKIPKDTK